VADAADETQGRTAARTLDAGTQERLLALLQAELARACDEALAHGMTPQKLTAQLDARIARLRAQIEDLSAGERAA
jgi:uncharacterized protein YceH (UPF0502 family)